MNAHELNQFKIAVQNDYKDRGGNPDLETVIQDQVRISTPLRDDAELLNFVREIRAWADLFLCRLDAAPVASMDPTHPLALWDTDPKTFGDWLLDPSKVPCPAIKPRGRYSPPPPPFKATR